MWSCWCGLIFLLALAAIVVIAGIIIVSYKNDRQKTVRFNKPTEYRVN